MNSRNVRYLLSLIALAITYFVTAKAGLGLNAVSGFATLIWPPTGIALAALLLGGYRLWPAITVAAFAVNFLTGASPLIALGIAIGNTLEPIVGTFVLRHVGFEKSLRRMKDVLCLVILAAFFGTMISTTIGVGSLLLGGALTPNAFDETWVAWWIGDMLGALVVTPLILVWASQPRASFSLRKLLEPLAAVALLVAMNVIVFSGSLWPGHEPSMFAYLIFPPLIWIALRFGQRGSATAIFIMSVIAITSTLTAQHMTAADMSNSLLLLQRFIGITAVTFMIISAIIAERRLAQYAQLQLLQKTIDLDRQGTYLKQLNEAKDEFISLASHQLRTPASGIKMHLGMMLENKIGKLTRAQRKSAQIAYDMNEREIKIVDGLLRVAQFDIGYTDLRKEMTDMKRLVTDVIHELEPTIEEREQSIDFVYGSDTYMTSVDRRKMAIVLENLIDNASKFSQAGKNVEVELARDSEGLNIEVKDKGVGIAKKDQGKLFKKFSRIDNELSIERGGTGVGLYWVKSIIKMHGGRISVSSKVGQGSVFTISL